MRSITLSTDNSRRWDSTDAPGAAYRRTVLADAQRGANELGDTIEVYHADGHVLEALVPERQAPAGLYRAAIGADEGGEYG